MKVFLAISSWLITWNLLISVAGATDGTLAISTDSMGAERHVSVVSELAGAPAITDGGVSSAVVSIPDDPYLDRQWGLSQIGLLEQPLVEGRSVLVAVLDTGVDCEHEDLNGKVIAEVNFTGSPVSGDTYGHGTHVAGIIAATTNNATGITGIAPGSYILSAKVADDTGRTSTLAVTRGIRWAVEMGASVINVSVEFDEPTSELEDAVNYAWRNGVLVVAAAGNNSDNRPVYPAYFENCIAVAGMAQPGTLAPCSGYGDWVDVAAPGFEVYSTLPGNRYGFKSGTSFATAHVSGLAALLFGIASDENGNGRVNDEVRAAIEQGCQGFAYVAAGRIDVAGSVARLISY